MRSGFDPTRRNRNFGTAARGHGRDNALVIPASWHEDRIFYEKLVDPRIVTRRLHRTEITFLIEPTREDCAHACSVDDVLAILTLLPPEDRLAVETFVFRQATRKQERLASCWGRLAYFANLGRFEGVAVYLEARRLDEPLTWSTSLTPLEADELVRLERDGHRVVRRKRCYEIHPTGDAVRTTQLYRTLPHEIGHYVHYRLAQASGVDHWARPYAEKEQFAHRYADTFAERAREAKQIPFPRKLTAHRLAKDGLRPAWFGA